jgi:TolA-binding protein
MSDWRRPDERWSPFEQDLLRAGKADAPGRGAAQKTLVALGVGTAGALGASATASGSVAGPAATAGAVAGAASKLAPIALAKWIAWGVVSVGALATAVHAGSYLGRVIPLPPIANPPGIVSPAPPVETHPGRASTPNERGVPAETALAKHDGEATASEPAGAKIGARRLQPPLHVLPESKTELVSPRAKETPAPIRTTDPAAAQSENTAPRATSEATGSGPVTTSGPLPPGTPLPSARLAEEMSLLQAARAPLRAGKPGLALRELDRYARTFPHGLLQPESIVLRIEAQLAQGDREEGAALGRQFLEAFPRSPLAPRVRGLLGP